MKKLWERRDIPQLTSLLQSTLIKKSGISFAIVVIGTGLGMLTRLILARWLGAEQFGYYAYVLQWAVSLGSLAVLGLGDVTLRYMPRYRVQQEFNLLRGFITYSYKNVLRFSVSTGLLMVMVVLAVWQFQPQLPPYLILTFLIAGLWLPTGAIQTLVSYQFLAYGNVVKAQAPLTIWRSVVQLTLLAALYFLLPPGWANAPVVMVTYLLATFSLLLFFGWQARQIIREEIKGVAAKFAITEWNQVTTPIFWQTVLRMLTQQADVLFVGLFLSTTDAGIYSIVMLLAMLIYYAIDSANIVIAPRIAELYSQHNYDGLQRLLTWTCLGVSVYATAMWLVMLVGGQWILWLFGEAFQVGYPALVILAAGRLAGSYSGSVGLTMNQTKYEREQFYWLIFGVIMGVVLNLVFIPWMGLVGAALATAISMTVWRFGMVLYVWWDSGLNTSILPLPKRQISL